MQHDPYTNFQNSLAQAAHDRMSISSFSNAIITIQYALAPEEYTRNGKRIFLRENLYASEFNQMISDINDSKKDDVQKDYHTLFSHVYHARIDANQAVQLARVLITKYKPAPKNQDVKPAPKIQDVKPAPKIQDVKPAVKLEPVAGGAAQEGADALSNELEAIKSAEINLGKAITATALSRMRLKQAQDELRAAQVDLDFHEGAQKQAIEAHEQAVRAYNDRKRKRDS